MSNALETNMDNYEQRSGEVRLSFDPAETATDAAVVFIG
jgi:hypothetical protein